MTSSRKSGGTVLPPSHRLIPFLVGQNDQEAIDVLEREPIDIVLVDLRMPNTESDATMRAIERFEGLPVIATTDEVVRAERELCFTADADDFLPEPADTADLLAVLRPWLLPAMESTP